MAAARLTMTANAALRGSRPRTVRPSGSPTGISTDSSPAPGASSPPIPLAASWLNHHLPLRDDRARDYRRTKKSPAQLAGLQFLRHHFDDRVVRCQLVRSAYFRIQVNPRSAA